MERSYEQILVSLDELQFGRRGAEGHVAGFGELSHTLNGAIQRHM